MHHFSMFLQKCNQQQHKEFFRGPPIWLANKRAPSCDVQENNLPEAGALPKNFTEINQK